MMLTDLLNYVSRIWTPPPKIQSRTVMTIPGLKDLNNSRQQEKVQDQCRECAKQLAPNLYRWVKPYPEKANLKRWNAESQSFVGMSIEDFAHYLMAHFTLKTDDGREWLHDPAIADRIWAACAAADGPLPIASWEIETDLKRKAMLNPVDSTSEFGNSQTPAR